jgi:hypothetical protein
MYLTLKKPLKDLPMGVNFEDFRWNVRDQRWDITFLGKVYSVADRSVRLVK